MSVKARDSRTGKDKRRVSPLVSFQVDVELWNMIEEVMKLYNWGRSEAVSRCLLIGMDEYKRSSGIS